MATQPPNQHLTSPIPTGELRAETWARRTFTVHSKAGGAQQDCLQHCTHTARTQEVCSGTRPSLPALQEPHITSPRASSAPALTEQRASHCSRAKALQHQRSSSKPAVSSAALLGARWACEQLTAAGGAPSSPGCSPELSTARSVLLLAQGTAGAHLRGEELPAPHLGLRAEAAPGCAARLRQPAPTSLWQLLARSRHHTEQLLQGSCCRRQRHQTPSSPGAGAAPSPVPCPLLQCSAGCGQRKVHRRCWCCAQGGTT